MLEGYDFWAHGDNDMLLGNVSKFLTPTLLANHDIIAGAVDDNPLHRTWGPFTVMRNSPLVYEMFKLAPGLRATFDSQYSFFFDEWGGDENEQHWYSTSMSKVVNDLIDQKKIRWHGGFPIGWDGYCAKKGELGYRVLCSECKLTVKIVRDESTTSSMARTCWSGTSASCKRRTRSGPR